MRPSLAAALRHPISGLGIALTTASALLFLALLTLQFLGFLQNPYAGIVVFVLVPALFAVGLLLIPIGLWRDRRRARAGANVPVWPRIDLNDPGIRRTVLFVAGATVANFAILSLASYGTVEYTESTEFCGQVCHDVMEPEFVAHQSGPHARVACVACHTGPGPEGFISAKLNGVRQLRFVISGGHDRPIPTPIESLPDVQNSCEQCHFPDRFIGDVIKTVYEHADDEANTQMQSTLRMRVGGPVSGSGTGTGIHWHMNRANQVEYVALDDKREEIPYVRVTTPGDGAREYFAEGVTAEDLAGMPVRRMGCLDCHNRPAHTFGSTPERAVDAALGEGLISATIPFIRREAVRALGAPYPSHEVASSEIERMIRDAMEAEGPFSAEESDLLRQAIGVTQAIYRNNVFPSMSVGWGTYPNQLGHMTSTGCFRCHDETHETADGRVISQDCEACHGFE